MGTLLVACPSCSCHAFARETRCPSCGALLRATDGSIQRTAGAVLLGLSITVATASCGSSSGGAGGGGGHGGAPSAGSMGGFQAIAAYGIGPTTTNTSGGGMGGGSDDAGSDAGSGDAGSD